MINESVHKFEVISASIEDKPVVDQLLQFYLYDASSYSDRDVDAHGCFTYRYLDHYWAEAERFAYLFQVQGKWAGFGLVNPYVMLAENLGGNSIAEFFVMRKYRRAGIGRDAFRYLVAQHPGRWEIRVEQANRGGMAFWGDVVPELTGGGYCAVEPDAAVWEGKIYSFDYPQRDTIA